MTANFKSSLNASVFAPDALVVGVSPLLYAEATRANYRSNVLCSNSLSSALVRTKPGKKTC